MGADLRTALARVSGAWLIAMPVAACNLILVTAVEDKVLIGDPLFGHVLPLAARGMHFRCLLCMHALLHHLMPFMLCCCMSKTHCSCMPGKGCIAHCSKHTSARGPNRTPLPAWLRAQARGSPS